jgi:hypothetical protein
MKHDSTILRFAEVLQSTQIQALTQPAKPPMQVRTLATVRAKQIYSRDRVRSIIDLQ